MSTPLYFRLRILIILAIYILGFSAPWTQWWPGEAGKSLTWLALAGLLAGLGVINLQYVTVIVTIVAAMLLWSGALLRLWAAAYLRSPVVQSSSMHGAELVAAGPYRYVRNPLYLGSALFALGVSILMPPSGAIVFLVLLLGFYGLLIAAEERFLAAQNGERYARYCAQVPRLWPRFKPAAEPPGRRGGWPQAMAGESLMVGFAAGFTLLAWRYNAQLLLRALLVCFGVSLVLRALLPRRTRIDAA